MSARALATLAVVLAATLPSACGEEDEPLIGVAAGPYEVTLPAGWSEGTEAEKDEFGLSAGAAVEEAAGGELDVPGVGLTSLWLKGQVAPDKPNAIVIREPIPESLDAQRFVTIALANAERAFSSTIVEPFAERDEIEVAGEPARVFDYEIRFGDRSLAKRAVFILHDDVAYTLTMTSTPEDFDEVAAELDEILASWTWT